MSVRFAPSPTGVFHLGNLRTAWVSHRLARRLGMPWVVRFEDIDEPRNVPGVLELQLEHMRALGCVPDKTYLQSARRHRHWEVFVRAAREGRVYPCFCSRKDVRDALEGAASAPHGAVPVYNGRCRNRGTDGRNEGEHESIGWRWKSQAADGSQDFIVARTSPRLDSAGLPPEPSFAPAYNWACALDDGDGHYPLIVRGQDLGSVLEGQREIQRWLGAAEEPRALPVPSVFHCSLVTRDDGGRLEKRTKGVTLPELMALGWTRSAIVARFAASLDAVIEELVATELSRGVFETVFAESKSQLTIGELGFSGPPC